MRAFEGDNCACRATLRMRERVRSWFEGGQLSMIG
jgi:hypothetical protein